MELVRGQDEQGKDLAETVSKLTRTRCQSKAATYRQNILHLWRPECHFYIHFYRRDKNSTALLSKAIRCEQEKKKVLITGPEMQSPFQSR